MIATMPRRLMHQPPRLALHVPVVQKAQMLWPRDIDENLHPQLVGDVQKPIRRHVIGADGVDADSVHTGEIIDDALRFRKLLVTRIRRKWAVGDALDSKPLAAMGEEFPIHADPQSQLGGAIIAKGGSALRNRDAANRGRQNMLRHNAMVTTSSTRMDRIAAPGRKSTGAA